MEEAAEILGCYLSSLFNAYVMQLGQLPRHFAHSGRFVAATSIRLRRQVRTVGLDQDLIERQPGSHQAKFIRFLESERAGERDEKTDLDPGCRKIIAAGITMEDAPKARFRPLLAQDLLCVCFRIASVNDHRKTAQACQLQLPSECVALHLSRRIIVVIVESDLSPPDHFRMMRELEQSLCEGIIE